jgi:hypothetical protein
MTAWLLVILALALVLLAMAYAITPVIVALTYRLRTDDTVVRLDRAGRESTAAGPPPGLPGDVYPAMRAHLDRLQALGFVAQGWYQHAGAGPAVQVYVAAAARPAERLTAVVVTSVLALDTERRLHDTHVQIACERADGHEIATTSADALLPPAALRDRLLVQAPEVRDPADLLDLHRRLLVHLSERARAAVALRPVPSAADWPAFLRRGQRRQIASMVEAELLAPVGDGITYRPTLPGALLLAWSALWPVSWLRRYQRDRRTAVLLARLGWPGH